jgi:hypothetical protein
MKKPDNVADNPGLLPYASNVRQIETKFNELKEEYLKLVEEYRWNELVYQAKFSYEPVIGETYYLYVGRDGNPFLSLIAPNEWDKEHIGSFKLNSEQKWIKL